MYTLQSCSYYARTHTHTHTHTHMQCSRDSSLKSFLRQITTGVNKVALLGCGCSSATEPVAEISGFWNITHVRLVSLTCHFNLKCLHCILSNLNTSKYINLDAGVCVYMCVLLIMSNYVCMYTCV